MNVSLGRVTTPLLDCGLPGKEEAEAFATSLPVDPGPDSSSIAEWHRDSRHTRDVQEDNGQAYRSCELKVSFKSIYQECLGRAKEHFAAKPVETEHAEPQEEVVEVPDEPLDPRAGYSGEAEELPIEAPRIRGPQLPGATVGAVGDESASESDGEAGPRGEGEEREGVDLRYVDPEKSGREEWMTMAPERIFVALHG